MPVSKKRKLKNGRKASRNCHGHLSTLFMPQWRIDRVKERFSDISLIAELKLGTGACNYHDVSLLRDVINATAWVSMYRIHITKDLNPDWLDANSKLFSEGQDAFQTFYERGCKKGAAKDPTIRFVASGDEFTKIKDVVAIGYDFVREMLEEKPLTFCKLFDAMKQWLGEKGFGRRGINEDDILKIMQRI